jgi:hypothetical protein
LQAFFAEKSKKAVFRRRATGAPKPLRVFPAFLAFCYRKNILLHTHTLSYESFWIFWIRCPCGHGRPAHGGRHVGWLCGRVGFTLCAMETLDYWTPADALAFRCSVSDVGTLKPADVSRETQPGNAADRLRADVAEARLYAPRAMRALARLMEGDNERVALGAAKEILLRAYGAPLQPVPAPLPAAPATPEAAHPEWLAAQRLAYRAGDYDRQSPEYLAGQCLPRQ